MPKEIQLWRVEGTHLQAMPQGRLDLESRLEEWLHRDVSLLGQRLLVIGRQVATDYGGFIDLLCVDAVGDLVIVELKRDRTPREVTAQILDYASWASDLSAERIAEIAARYLGSESLESAFRSTFEEDLPEILNQDHKLLLVGSEIDPASERIIRYLSEKHGVSINAISFQYFRTPVGDEILGRVHFLEPDQVESKAREKGGSKRRRALSLDDLEALADENGVGKLYRAALSIFQPLFNYTQTTQSGLSLAASFGGRTGRVINFLPATASAGELPFQLYTNRASERFGVSVDRLVASLPRGSAPWSYDGGQDPWWGGHAGSFHSEVELEELQMAMRSAGGGDGVDTDNVAPNPGLQGTCGRP